MDSRPFRLAIPHGLRGIRRTQSLVVELAVMMPGAGLPGDPVAAGTPVAPDGAAADGVPDRLVVQHHPTDGHQLDATDFSVMAFQVDSSGGDSHRWASRCHVDEVDAVNRLAGRACESVRIVAKALQHLGPASLYAPRLQHVTPREPVPSQHGHTGADGFPRAGTGLVVGPPLVTRLAPDPRFKESFRESVVWASMGARIGFKGLDLPPRTVFDVVPIQQRRALPGEVGLHGWEFFQGGAYGDTGY